MSHAARRLYDLGLTWTLAGEQRAGRGRVVWLAVGPYNRRIVTSTRPEALRIEETGRVPTVRVTNRSPSPTVIVAHVLLAGGMQTRAVERSVVLGPSAEALVPVRCVERQRWAPRAESPPDSFVASDRMSIPVRSTMSRAKTDTLRATGVYEVSQRRVWQEVDDELRRENTSSGTSSYEAVSRVRTMRIESARAASVVPPAGVNAMMIVPDEGGIWLEAFATPQALVEHAASIAADLFGPPTAVRVARQVRSVAEAADWIWRRAVVPMPAVAGTLGEASAIASDRASGEVLTLDGALAHAMVTASVAVVG